MNLGFQLSREGIRGSQPGRNYDDHDEVLCVASVIVTTASGQ